MKMNQGFERYLMPKLQYEESLKYSYDLKDF